MEKENIKAELYILCQAFVESRFETIQNTISEIQESLTSETKSSAGDKHETGRAMLQLEREKAGNQLAEIQKIKEILAKVNPDSSSKTIGLGSVVYTNKANYFIAISAGELLFKDERFYAISANTPIGQLLLGKTKGDTVTFRTDSFEIKDVF
ncbi:GreA/GreB family elongation factor [Tamlana agarivorans]|uniref:GreA/GreB family elongation factor n=1 Tax=Pseudotamlana agarivorans TaxID=481183 RepID=A0ACC5U608_9FLAO|nr:GreA/GreB family elongation factor [Tamlana agarivorans]MBU2949730.1 GreA/GreB family elongation factor [Tamlana agarivorans]